MSDYASLIYPSDEGNPYPRKLCTHIYERFYRARAIAAQDLSFLDVGCSKGTHLDLFRAVFLSQNPQLSFKGFGSDVRDEGIGERGFEFRSCDLEREKLPFESDYFECVYSKSVCEHVLNADNMFSEIRRVLKPGGMLVCMTPDWKSQMTHFWDDYTHVKPWTRKGLRDCLIIHGFQNVDCELFYQLPHLWKTPWLTFVSRAVALVCPDRWKWKNREERNTRDNKFIRFSKELMLLAYGKK